MLLRSLHSTVRNFRGITRVVSQEICLKVPVQHYGRFAPRKPVAIINEDELYGIEEYTAPTPTPPKLKKSSKTRSAKPKNEEVSHETIEKLMEKDSMFNMDDEIGSQMGTEAVKKASSKIKSKPKEISVQKSKKQKPPREAVQEDDGTQPEDSKLVYTKVHENEKIVSSIMMSLRSKKQRKKNDQILLEGQLFIKDAIEAGLVPETIIFSRWEDVKDLPVSNKVTKLYKVPYRTIQLWSTLTTSPGIMGIFQKPGPMKESKSSLPITIICDNIRDPGNMGTILRAAAGVGCEKLILTKGCVDFWDTKVLRSAAGAHFRIPIYGSKEWDEIKTLIHADAHVYVADSNVGNYLKEQDEDDSIDEMEEEDEESSSDEDEKKMSRKQPKRAQYANPSKYNELAVVPYYSVDYTKNQVVLIVGGETKGISTDSYRLVRNRQGVRVNVPLTNGIDSLNAGMALGIVAFEVKRQFLLIHNKLNELSAN